MESLFIFFILFFATVCGVIFIVQMVRLISRKKLSAGGWITASIAFLLICLFLGSAMSGAATEYNPTDTSLERISGHYIDDDASLTLRPDGTYTAVNLKGVTSGTWSHFDWNLNFSGSTLEQPRWITKWGNPVILPDYAGADGSDGRALKKQ